MPVRSWPRWSRRIPTRIAHGIGHGRARVFMESLWQQGGYPKLADSAPNATHQRDCPAGRAILPYTGQMSRLMQRDASRANREGERTRIPTPGVWNASLIKQPRDWRPATSEKSDRQHAAAWGIEPPTSAGQFALLS